MGSSGRQPGLPFASTTLEAPGTSSGCPHQPGSHSAGQTQPVTNDSPLRSIVWPLNLARLAPRLAQQCPSSGGPPRPRTGPAAGLASAAGRPASGPGPFFGCCVSADPRIPAALIPRSARQTPITALAAVPPCVVIIARLLIEHRPDGQIHVTVLDVRQGGSISSMAAAARLLIDGDQIRIVCTGRPPRPTLRHGPADRPPRLAHPPEDHVAGLPDSSCGRYRIGRVIEPGMLGPGPGYAAWTADLARRGIASGRLSTVADSRWTGSRSGALWPDAECRRSAARHGTGINNVSIVLLGERDGRRMLLMGDVEEGIDPILIGRGLPHVDLLKVAHHGSHASSGRLPGGGSANDRRRLRRAPQPIRTSEPGYDRPIEGHRRGCVPNGPERHGRRHAQPATVSPLAPHPDSERGRRRSFHDSVRATQSGGAGYRHGGGDNRIRSAVPLLDHPGRRRPILHRCDAAVDHAGCAGQRDAGRQPVGVPPALLPTRRGGHRVRSTG